MTCLSLTLRKKLENLSKNGSIPRMDEKKLHTREFQLKGIGQKHEMKVASKLCSKHLRHIAIEKDIFSNISKVY